MTRPHLSHEAATALKFGAVGCVGFLTDITVLRPTRLAGVSPFAGRALSLTCAMQVTFLVNGWLVFRCLVRENWKRQWVGYMSTNGLGNLCNYLIFSGLVLSGWPQVSRHGWALLIGSVCAYLINYLFVRLLVFGRPQTAAERQRAALCTPCEPGASAVK
jgi:putative flippase GtrA